MKCNINYLGCLRFGHIRSREAERTPCQHCRSLLLRENYLEFHLRFKIAQLKEAMRNQSHIRLIP